MDIYTGVTTVNGRPVIVSIVHDISTRKAAEDALRASEEHYHSVFASMSEGLVIHDSSGAIISCHASAEAVLGLTADQIYGKTPLDPNWRAIHEDGSPFPGETHPASITLQTGNPCRNVIMGVHLPDGSLHWILINSQPVFLENSTRPGTVIATFMDITERKIAEEKLDANEELLSKAFENSQDAIVITTPDGIIFAANPAACRMSGMTEEEMILAGQNNFFDTNDPALGIILEEFNRTGKFFGVLTFIRKDGSTFPGEISAIRFKDAYGNIRTSSTIRDISERKLAEEKKQEAESRYRSLFKHSNYGIFILDFQCKHLT